MDKLSKIYIYLLLLFMYAPLISIVVFSFTDNSVFGVWDGFSLGLYKNLFNGTVEGLTDALGNTLVITLIVSVISTVLGTFAAIGYHNSHNALHKGIASAATNIDIAMPDIIIAVALMLTFVFLGVSRGFATIIIGQVVLCVPFAFFCVLPALRSMDKYIYEAAADMGANWWQTLWYVILPQLRMSVASAFFICMAYSLDDYIITLFCNGTDSLTTLSTMIYTDAARSGLTPEIRPLYAIFFLIVLVALIVLNLLNTLKKKRQTVIVLLLFCGMSMQASAASNERSHILKVTHYASCLDDHIISGFEKWYKEQTGEDIHVIYKPFENDIVALNNMVLAKEDWDVIYANNDNVVQFIRQGFFAPIDMKVLEKTHTPDYSEAISSYLRQRLKTMIPDQDMNIYCRPMTMCSVGIMYDATKYKREQFENWDFLSDPAYENEILLPNVPSDLYCLGLCSLYDRQVRAGRMAPLTLGKMIEPKFIPKIESRLEVCMKNCAGWAIESNYEAFMQKNFTIMPFYNELICGMDEDLKAHSVGVVFPKSCSFQTFTHMLVPKYAQNKKAAAYWISYMSSPEMTNYQLENIGYMIPLVDSREVFDFICDEKKYPETVDISYLFPSIPEAKHAHVSNMIYPDKYKIDRYFFFTSTKQTYQEVTQMTARLQIAEPEWIQLFIALVIFLLVGAWTMYFVIKRNRNLRKFRRIQQQMREEEARKKDEEERKRVILLDAARRSMQRDDINPDDDLVRMGLDTQLSVGMAFLSQEAGVFIKTSDILRWRSVNAMVHGKMSLGWWVSAYSPDKPVLLAVFGNRTMEEWLPELKELCDKYSVFALEPVDELMDNVFIDAKVEDMAMLYQTAIDIEIPDKVRIEKIMTGDKLAEDISAFLCSSQFKNLSFASL